MKKILIVITMVSLILCSCSGGVSQEEFNKVQSDLEEAKKEISEKQAAIDNKQKEFDQLKAQSESELSAKDVSFNKLQSEYDAYKEKMQPYETLSEAESKAKLIEAEKVAKEKEAAEKAAAEKAIKEAEKKEKAGYNTGITYNQLARTPDDYKGQKVKFKGEVVQVMEGDGEVQIRFAVDKDYDKIILCSYNSSIVTSRILEDDVITIYGTSAGLFTYQSTLGGDITVPLVFIDKIDQ